MTEYDKQLEEQYEQDLHDLVDTYRTIKNIGKWAAWLFGLALAITGTILAILQITGKK